MPHKESKQNELLNAITNWIIMDSQSFNAVNGLEFQNMIKKFDSAFRLLYYRTIKKTLGISYQTTFQVIKELIGYESLNNNDYNLTLDNSTFSQPLLNQVSSDFTLDQILSEPTDELSLKTNREVKKVYEILKKWFLKLWEWDLLDQLIELFKPIEEVMEWLSGQKYCILSLIFPTIQVLKYDYIIIEENSKDETEEEPEIKDIDDNTDDNTDNEVDEPKKPNIDKIIKLVKNTIYDALFKYFDFLPDSVLLA
ncbi:19480_t:CDS:2, partial [Racocetra persica]